MFNSFQLSLPPSIYSNFIGIWISGLLIMPLFSAIATRYPIRMSVRKLWSPDIIMIPGNKDWLIKTHLVRKARPWFVAYCITAIPLSLLMVASAERGSSAHLGMLEVFLLTSLFVCVHVWAYSMNMVAIRKIPKSRVDDVATICLVFCGSLLALMISFVGHILWWGTYGSGWLLEILQWVFTWHIAIGTTRIGFRRINILINSEES